MRTIGQLEFPDAGNTAEIEAWKPLLARIALHRQVLVVAKTRIEGRWSAYCASVPGQNHDDEWQEVVRQGSKLPEKWARSMFPEFQDLPYAR